MRSNYFACVLLLAASGCEKNDPLFCKENPGATGCPRPDGDAPFDEWQDAVDTDPGIDARLCYGAGAYAFCLTAPPVDPVIFNGTATLDTSPSNTNCAAIPAEWTSMGQPDACFIIGTMISIPTLNVSGSRPLVLVSATTIQITAALDVAGHRSGLGNKLGPGADAACTASTGPGSDVDGGGGGAGGSFVTAGADGGDGNTTNNNGVPAAALGQLPNRLRAGCSGQAGGNGNGGAAGGVAGRGGGAVYLLAGTQITLADGAVINASGGAGDAPGREAGGGGGGSGGMVLLFAPTILAQGAGAFIIANGGGGAAGEDDQSATAAVPGDEPVPTTPTVAAAGGNGAGGDGGAGATEGDPAQQGSNAGANKGGGGGGGGKGYIQSNLDLVNVTTSPTVQVIAAP